MSISPQNLLGNQYLKERPHVYNGGIVAQYFSNLVLNNISVNRYYNIQYNFIPFNYIERFFFGNVSKEPDFTNLTLKFKDVNESNASTSVLGLLYIIVALTFCFILSVIWIFYKACKTYPLCQKWCDKLFRINVSQKSSVNFIFLSNLTLLQKKRRFFQCITIFCTICFLVLPFFLCSCIFSSILQSNLQQQMMDSNNNKSFSSSWQQSSQLLNEYFDIIINQSNFTFNGTIYNISAGIKNLLSGSLNKLINQMLLKIGVNEIFSNANRMILNLNETSQGMTFIKENSAKILKDINWQTGSLNAIVEHLKFLVNLVCEDRIVIKTECLKYLIDLEKLKIGINTSLINDHSSVNMLFILEQFQLNLTSLSKNIFAIENKIKEEISEKTKKQAELLNLDEVSKRIIPLLNIVSDTISSWKKNFDTLNISAYTSFKSYGKTFISITSLLLAIVSGLLIIFTLLLIRYSFIYIFEKQIITESINKSNYEPISVLKHYYKKQILYKLKKYYKPHNAAIYSFLLVFSIVIIIMVILSFAMINASHLLYNEVCIQIWNTKGFRIIDKYLDIFLKVHWAYITSLIIPKLSVISSLVSPPNQVLQNIKTNCQNDSGIFGGFNISNFINISEIIWTPKITKALHDGLNLTYSIFIETDTKSLIPNNIASFIKTALSVGKYFDDIDYQSTIDELSKGVIQLQGYETWMKSALNFFSSFNNTSSNEITRLLSVIYSNLPNLQNLETNISKLRYNFQIIQDKRNNSLYIQKILFSIETVKVNLVNSPELYYETEKLYNIIMMKDFPTEIESFLYYSITETLRLLFPCQKLFLAISGILNNLCSSNYTAETICSYGLSVGILSAFMMAMFHFLWVIIRKDLIDNEEFNISTC